jgi:hypothetical protein
MMKKPKQLDRIISFKTTGQRPPRRLVHYLEKGKILCGGRYSRPQRRQKTTAKATCKPCLLIVERRAWDWDKTNKELATLHRLPISTIRYIRARLGLPSQKPRSWYTGHEDEIDWRQSNKALGKQFNVDYQTISNTRRKLRTPRAPGTQPKRSDDQLREIFDSIYKGVPGRARRLERMKKFGLNEGSFYALVSLHARRLGYARYFKRRTQR